MRAVTTTEDVEMWFGNCPHCGDKQMSKAEDAVDTICINCKTLIREEEKKMFAASFVNGKILGMEWECNFDKVDEIQSIIFESRGVAYTISVVDGYMSIKDNK